MKLDIHNPESVAFMFKSKSKTLNRQQNGNMSKWLFPLLPTTTTHTHPIDSQVLRPDGSKSCLFWTHVCPMQDVMAFFAHHCPSLLQDLHVQGHIFHRVFGGVIFLNYFSSEITIFQSPRPLVFFPWCDVKIPGGFSLHHPQQSHTTFTLTLYSGKLIIWEEEQPS